MSLDKLHHVKRAVGNIFPFKSGWLYSQLVDPKKRLIMLSKGFNHVVNKMDFSYNHCF